MTIRKAPLPRRKFISISPASSLKCFCQILVFCGVAELTPRDANAVSFRLPNQDPEAIARGNAFAATADNPSAIYYNPAGITQLEGHNFNVGLYLVSANTDYESPTGLTAETSGTFQAVPQVYYVYSPAESRFSYGLGIYAPFGLSLDWGKNSPFRTLAQNGRLLYSSINPVIAYQIHPTLSIGIGPTIDYSEAKFERAIGVIPDDFFKFQGDGMDYGFNAGILWHPHEKWSFGVNYRFQTTIDYKGHTEAFPFFPPVSSTAKLEVPQFAVVGISFRPTENWNIEFDLDWTDWDDVNEILFRGTSFGDVPFVQNYTSSFMYEIGVTRRIKEKYFIHAGYFYSENSIPDHDFNPIIPDANLHLGSVGFSYRGQRWNWALAYHFGYNPGREVTGSVPGGIADGTYQTLNHAVNISATYKF